MDLRSWGNSLTFCSDSVRRKHRVRKLRPNSSWWITTSSRIRWCSSYVRDMLISLSSDSRMHRLSTARASCSKATTKLLSMDYNERQVQTVFQLRSRYADVVDLRTGWRRWGSAVGGNSRTVCSDSRMHWLSTTKVTTGLVLLDYNGEWDQLHSRCADNFVFVLRSHLICLREERVSTSRETSYIIPLTRTTDPYCATGRINKLLQFSNTSSL